MAMGEWIPPSTRRFNGKVYTFYHASHSERAIEIRKDELMEQGYKVRVIHRDGVYALYGR